MLLILQFIFLLVLALIQETITGGSLVLAWVAAGDLVLADKQAKQTLSWSLIAGLVVDLAAGDLVGKSSLFYILITLGLILIAKRLPRKNRGLVSLIFLGVYAIDRLIWRKALGLGGGIIGVLVFWLMVVLMERWGEWQEGGRQLRLKT